MRRLRTTTVLLLAATLLAAQRPTWRIDEAPPELKPAIIRANLIVVEIQNAVLRELAGELAEGGPENAAMTCHIDSRLVIQRLQREGVRGGRTSDRLRSAANAAPAWAAQLVADHAGRLAREVPGFAVDLGDRVGVLHPIAETHACASCHGPVEHLSPGVRKILRERFPSDRAVGYREGEIRGWFWLEVPKRSQ